MEPLETRVVLAAPHPFDLASLLPANGGNGSTGVTLFGVDAGDLSGRGVHQIGDMNGDGFDDLLIGAPLGDAAENAKADAGESYVVFGKADWSSTSTLDLATLNGTNGFMLFGVGAVDFSGHAVGSAGDVNGDGFDDLLIGAIGGDAPGHARSNAGESYVVFGKSDWSASPKLDLTTLNGTNGFMLFGVDAGDVSGSAVSSAGDVNGDGFDDLLIGAKGGDSAGNVNSYAGESYVVFGKVDWSSMPTLDLSTLNGINGVTLLGIDAFDRSGFAISGVGDVNGDGFDDLLIGADLGGAAGNANNRAGESYVVFGKDDWSATPTMDLATLNGTNGFTLFGIGEYDYSGHAVSGAGDVNGDGFDDLLIGAHKARAAGNANPGTGESYVVFGKAAWSATPVLSLAMLNGINGFTLAGVDEVDFMGNSVSGAGDVNGDGFDDLLIGANGGAAAGNAKGAAGESYVVFGKEDWSATPTLDLATLNGTNGFTLFGVDGIDFSGYAVSSAGDVNGDGFDDLLIGARDADAAGNAKPTAGESYVVFGGNFTDAVTHLGSGNDDTLAGTAAANVMNGGRGNDVLVGNGGADVLYGGQGDDVLAVSSSTFARIDGGNGADTLRLDGAGISLNLTTLADNRLTSIEAIDMRGSGANTLTLDLAEVLNITEGSNPARTANTLTIRRDADDTITKGTGWSQRASVSVSGITYQVFTQAAATLLVEFLPITTIDLANLGTGGITIFGVDAGDFSGRAVHHIGDMNGDGFGDILIGANGGDAAGNAKLTAGDSYVVFGKSDWSATSTLDLATLNGTNGFTLFGIESGDQSGVAVSGAGDVNGDGFDDLLIGAIGGDVPGNARPGAGESYIVFGNSDWSSNPTLDLTMLNGTNGFTLFGVDAGDVSGWAVSRAGDVNGDGFDDLLIGAKGGDSAGNAKSYAGESYVVFGKADWSSTPLFDLATLNGINGITLFGIDAADRSGQSLSGLGDLNGDGFDDLLIGADFAGAAANASDRAGESYVVFGKADWSATPTVDLATLNGTNGVTLFGIDAYDYSGHAVSGAGDVNGDGFDDLLIGAYRSRAEGNAKFAAAGEVYIVFGKADWSAIPALSLAMLNGTNGFTLFGAEPFDQLGKSVSGAGDVNGDGFDDLLIGADGGDAGANAKLDAGESYVLFGKSDWSTTPTLDLATLNGTNGLTLFGVDAGDESGFAVSGGDVNGDGFDDLLIGAFRAGAAGNSKPGAGESYMVFGGNFTNSATHIGTAAGEILNGSAGGDRMVGGQGKDTLVGGGGADVLYGGQGDDVLSVSSAGFSRVDGGNGGDTLRFSGGGIMLDLTAIADNRLTSIETLDIRGRGSNTLTLNLREVLNLTETSNPAATSNTLTVRANVDDTVNMGTGWTLSRTETIGGVSYLVFTQGAATLKVSTTEPRPTRMYRAYNPNADFHFFTTSFAQFDNAVRAGYRDETAGNSGFEVLEAPVTDDLGTATPIYRVYNLQRGFHYYTLNLNEKNFLVNIVPPPASGPDTRTIGWRDEGIESYMYAAPAGSTAPSGTTLVHRLYNTNSGVHLFTQDINTRNAILAQFPGIWVEHSPVGYAFAVNASGQATARRARALAESQAEDSGDAVAAWTSTIAGGSHRPASDLAGQLASSRIEDESPMNSRGEADADSEDAGLLRRFKMARDRVSRDIEHQVFDQVWSDLGNEFDSLFQK